MELEKSGIKICLLVEHGCPEMSHSMYVIEPPLEYEEEKHIDSEGFMIESISPVITVKQRGDCFITQSAMVKLGSRVYLFGGLNNIHDFNFFWKYDIHENIPTTPDDEQKVSVRVLDVDHPELGLLSVASLNAPKQTPCVFSARGMIYALGSLIPGDDNIRSGCFERYDPAADKWQLLPDPPLSLEELEEARWCDCATVVRDRYVFVGDDYEYLIFDLDTQEWAPLPQSHFFPCGSLYVDGSLYYLRGRGAAKPATEFDPERRDHLGCKLELAKRGPLLDVDDPSRLLKSHCLLPKNAQVMATVGELDEDTFFTGPYFPHWRDIFHLGGRFFCYVVTSQLVDWHSHTIIQPYCRGVRIKVFEEVPSFNSSHEAHFRTLASFCYKIRTPFPNDEFFIRCCAFGSVPDAWVKAPLKKKQVVTTERKALKAEQSQHGGGSYEQKNCNLEKIVAAREEENMRLKAELARKDELLKVFMAKSEGKLVESVLRDGHV